MPNGKTEGKAPAKKRKASPKKKTIKKDRKPKQVSRAKNFSFKDVDGKLQFLTELQYNFCMEYLRSYGNRTESVIEAGYDVWYRDSKGKKTDRPNYNQARVIASENLRKPNVSAFITSKLSDFGWDDPNVELQHLALINQWDNVPTKQKSIDMYYKLKNKYPAQKIEHSGKVDVIEVTSYGTKPEGESNDQNNN